MFEFVRGDMVELRLVGRLEEETDGEALVSIVHPKVVCTSCGDEPFRAYVPLSGADLKLAEPPFIRWGEVYRAGRDTFAVVHSDDEKDFYVFNMRTGDRVHPRTLIGAQKIFDVDDTA